MKPFFSLLLIFFTLAIGAGVRAQDTAIKIGEAEISVSRAKWEKGVLNNLTPPDIFNSTSAESGSYGRSTMNLSRPIHGYYYQASFTNGSGSKIKGIYWEFVFFDSATKQEVGRHKFFSKTSIGKSKTKTVASFNRKPPSGTISAEALGEKEKKDQYIERIEIKAVLLGDGAMWKAPSASERDLNRLRVVVKRGRIFR